jgi:hypothetical protein
MKNARDCDAGAVLKRSESRGVVFGMTLIVANSQLTRILQLEVLLLQAQCSGLAA